MPDMAKGLQQYRIVPHHAFVGGGPGGSCARCHQFRSDAHKNESQRMTCRNAGCDAERNGWVSVLDPTDEKHRGAATFIEMEAGREYDRFLVSEAEGCIDRRGSEWGVDLVHLRLVLANALPHFIVYVFPPGQQCFKVHADREVVFARASREQEYLHDRPLDFNEDMNESAHRYYRATGRE